MMLLSAIRAALSPRYRTYVLERVEKDPPLSKRLTFLIRAIPFFCLLPFLAKWAFSA